MYPVNLSLINDLTSFIIYKTTIVSVVNNNQIKFAILHLLLLFHAKIYSYNIDQPAALFMVRIMSSIPTTFYMRLKYTAQLY